MVFIIFKTSKENPNYLKIFQVLSLLSNKINDRNFIH